MKQELKEKKQKDNVPEWKRLKGLWRLYLIYRGKCEIIKSQEVAKQIINCQKELKQKGFNVTIANFDELLNTVLWE